MQKQPSVSNEIGQWNNTECFGKCMTFLASMINDQATRNS